MIKKNLTAVLIYCHLKWENDGKIFRFFSIQIFFCQIWNIELMSPFIKEIESMIKTSGSPGCGECDGRLTPAPDIVTLLPTSQGTHYPETTHTRPLICHCPSHTETWLADEVSTTQTDLCCPHSPVTRAVNCNRIRSPLNWHFIIGLFCLV